ncbi:MAG TPA: ribosome biogenesis GTPase Der [Alphaproteobacteria bacterium]|nr:ribosome biogenesis GTPase Der [Alphaproteobacteria bacterium]
MGFTVAIVGRPNVGKSTLFNRLVGKRLAIVHDTPGVTRDRREGEARLGDLSFTAIDTAGLEEAKGATLEARMVAQTERAVDEADVALLLIDARAGVTPLDAHFARRLRRRRTPVILVANKCEGSIGEAALAEAQGLGLGEPVPISAEHGLGIADLLDALRPHARDLSAVDGADQGNDGMPSSAREDVGERPLHIAILGRPNVGKSTLANRLLGKERLLTGPEPGVTRDAISVESRYGDRKIRLVDTAGLRRRAKVTDPLEQLSAAETLRAVRFAEVVMLVTDGTDPLHRQDLGLASLVVEEGRALVIIVNKWDLVDDRARVLRDIRERIETSLHQIKGVAITPVSATTGEGLDKAMRAVFHAHEQWNRHLPTTQLNRFLSDVVEMHPPPLAGGHRSKIRYMTQPKTRPPTFALFGNKLEDLPASYQRYLINALRETFDLGGVPVRLVLRRGKNPYVKP